jgi:hypothetical protein
VSRQGRVAQHQHQHPFKLNHWKQQQVEGLVKRMATHRPAEPAALSAALGWAGRSEEEVGQLVEAVQQTLEVLAEVAEQSGPRARPFAGGVNKPGTAEEGAAAEDVAAGGASADGAVAECAVPMQVDQAADGQAAGSSEPQAAVGATEAAAGTEQGAAGSSKQVVTDPAELLKLVQARVAVPPVCAKALLAPAMLKVLARQARAHLEAIKEHAAVAAKRQADGSYLRAHQVLWAAPLVRSCCLWAPSVFIWRVAGVLVSMLMAQHAVHTACAPVPSMLPPLGMIRPVLVARAL